MREFAKLVNLPYRQSPHSIPINHATTPSLGDVSRRRLGESGDGELNDQHDYKSLPARQLPNIQPATAILNIWKSHGDFFTRNATSHLAPTTHN